MDVSSYIYRKAINNLASDNNEKKLGFNNSQLEKIDNSLISFRSSDFKFGEALKAQKMFNSKSISFQKEISHPKLRADMPIKDSLFHPKGIAVIGASSRGQNLGSFILSKIINGGFNGDIVAINPCGKVAFNDADGKSVCLTGENKYEGKDITGTNIVRNVYAGKCLNSIPTNYNVDTAVLVVKAEELVDTVEKCGQQGIKNLVIITNKLGEVSNEKNGFDGLNIQNKVVEICQKYGMSLTGPNCLGIANPSIHLDATFAPDYVIEGNAGFFAQSGAMIIAAMNLFNTLGIGFSSLASIGNKCGPDEVRYLDYFKQDPKTKFILGYLESINDPDQFLKESIDISKVKPIIMLKSGRSESGAQAAAAHTGSSAGGDSVYDALFKRAGIIRAIHNSDFLSYSQAFSQCPLPKNKKTVVISNGGGAGTLATDAIEKDYGLTMSKLPDLIQRDIEAMLPDGASAKNPIDTVAAVSVQDYLKAAELSLKQKEVSNMIAYLVPVGPSIGKEIQLLEGLSRLQEKYQKPVLCCLQSRKEDRDKVSGWLKNRANTKPLYDHHDDMKTEWENSENYKSLNYPIVPIYDTPEQAISALSKMVEYVEWRDKAYLDEGLINPNSIKRASNLSYEKKQEVHNIINNAINSGVDELSGDEAKKIFEAYGVRTSISTKIDKNSLTEENLKKLVEQNGLQFPLVVKINGTGDALVHKSDLKCVELNIPKGPNGNEYKPLLEKCKTVLENARNNSVMDNNHKIQAKESEIEGLIIQEYADGIYELYAGVNAEDSKIKMIEFGVGGIQKDLLDATIAIPTTSLNPLTDKEIQDFILKSPVKALFKANGNGKAYRGMVPANLQTMTNQLKAISEMSLDLPVSRLNINPFRLGVNGNDPICVDQKIKIDPERAKEWLKNS